MSKIKLTDMIAGNLMIDEEIKLGLLLQLISKEPIHILIVTDPGIGKTELLKNINKLVPNSHYVSGNLYGRSRYHE